MVVPTIEAPWIVGRPTEGPDWEFDVGPFAGTPTTFDTVEGLSEHGFFRTGRIVPSTLYGWTVRQLVTSEVRSGVTLQPSGLGWMGTYYYHLPASTPTMLEVVIENYAVAVTPGPFRALKALTLHRIGPWTRFLAGFDPVPALPTRTAAAEAPAPPVIREPESATSAELEAVEELRGWLGITYEQVATATGIGLRTVHHWKQSGATPRPRTVRLLWRLHALVHSVRRALGPDDALRWLRSGAPSPLDQIVDGDLSAAERRAQPLLFGQPLGERRFSGVATAEEPTITPQGRGRQLTRAARRPKSSGGAPT